MRLLALPIACLLLLAGCSLDGSPSPGPSSAPSSPPSSSASPSPSTSSSSSSSDGPSATPDQPETDEGPQGNPAVRRLSDRRWQHMVRDGVWRPECPVGRRDLRLVAVNHHTFSGDVRRGRLVVNKDVASSIARIFTELFQAGFPIRKMRPVEAYGGDVNVSLRADNTSAFNCRRPDQINAPTKKSPHANGRAIDINPRENPWKDLRCDCWSPGPENRKRTPGPGKILRGGVVWEAFIEEGWIWQNIDVPDYMHFDTGYPSRRFRG